MRRQQTINLKDITHYEEITISRGGHTVCSHKFRTKRIGGLAESRRCRYHFTQNNASFITAQNCIFSDNGFHIWTYGQTQFTNCIFVSADGKGGYSDSSGETRYLPTNSQAIDCISVNFPATFDIFGALAVRTGCPTSPRGYAAVFKTFTGVYSDEETFELTDDILAAYPNLGLYNGPITYTLTPSYPLITNMIVDPQTNDKGQLGVSVTVIPTE